MKEAQLLQTLPKSEHCSFYFKEIFFKIAQKVNKNLGNLCKKICHQELSKITQSGHMGTR